MSKMSFDRDEVERLYAAAHQRVVSAQGGNPTYFDNHIAFVANHLRLALDCTEMRIVDDDSTPLFAPSVRRALCDLQNIICRRRDGRYLNCAATWAKDVIRDVECTTFVRSQGTSSCLSWKGISLIKSIFDIGIYSRLLEELRPATLLEIGSGVGGSALWFKDQLTALGILCNVISVDVHPPGLEVPGVSYIYGDANSLSKYLTPEVVVDWPRPWLVIEDAHSAVTETLLCIDDYLEEGDYLVIEDSEGKRAEMTRFIAAATGNYLIDSHFTDFFGVNATSAADSVLVRRGHADEDQR